MKINLNLFLVAESFYCLSLFWPNYCLAQTISPTSILSLTPTNISPSSSTKFNIYLSELSPKPSSGEEWIEIYNPNAISVNLIGWQLWDELSSPSLIYQFADGIIAANTYRVISINRKLNDTEDGVTLKNPQGEIIDATHYINAQTDLAWSRADFESNPAQWSFQIASPGLVNPVILPTVTPLPTLTLAPTPTPTPAPTAAPSLTPTQISTSLPIPTLTSALNKSIKTILLSPQSGSQLSNTNQFSSQLKFVNQNITPKVKLISPVPTAFLANQAASASSKIRKNDPTSFQYPLTAIIGSWWLWLFMTGPLGWHFFINDLSN